MQRRKNIKLLSIICILVVVLTVLSFTGGKRDRLDIPRDHFVIENTQEINKVTFQSKQTSTELGFTGLDWQVNAEYKADPQRITVLFSILK